MSSLPQLVEVGRSLVNPGRTDSTAGVANTGSGGGGARTNTVAVGVTVGKAGGSGVVIVRYPLSGL